MSLLSRGLVEVAAALDLGFVDLLIDGVGLQQVVVGVKGVDPAVVQHQDAVGPLHAGHPLGDDDFCGAGDLLGKGLPDLGVGGGVHRGGS